MNNVSRKQVLYQFKKMHQVRKRIFQGDEKALLEAKNLINEGFKKNKGLKGKTEIKKEIQLAIDVIKELETNVVQAVEVKPGVYEATVREEILLDNHIYNPEADLKSSSKDGKCCGASLTDTKQTTKTKSE